MTHEDYVIAMAEECYRSAARGEEWGTRYWVYWNSRVEKLEHQGWKRKNGMTQNQKIIKHLEKAGSITVREALVDYSIQSLTKRIQELRQSGFDIISTVKRHPITGQQYTRYSLED